MSTSIVKVSGCTCSEEGYVGSSFTVRIGLKQLFTAVKHFTKTLEYRAVEYYVYVAMCPLVMSANLRMRYDFIFTMITVGLQQFNLHNVRLLDSTTSTIA